MHIIEEVDTSALKKAPGHHPGPSWLNYTLVHLFTAQTSKTN